MLQAILESIPCETNCQKDPCESEWWYKVWFTWPGGVVEASDELMDYVTRTPGRARRHAAAALALLVGDVSDTG